jgi:hypothetical protein
VSEAAESRVITFDPEVIIGERPPATAAYDPVTEYPVTAPEPGEEAPLAEEAGGVEVFEIVDLLAEGDGEPAREPVPEAPRVPESGYAAVLDDVAVASTEREAAPPAAELPADGQTPAGLFLEHTLSPQGQVAVDRRPDAAYDGVLGAGGPLLASADASFVPTPDAGASDAGVAATLPGPAPPRAPGNRVTVTEQRDAAGTVTAADVQLDNPDELFVPWSDTRTCGICAQQGLSARTSERRYRRPGRQPSLRTYDRTGAHRGAADAAQTDIVWNAAKTAQALDYIKQTVDAGLPVYVGVNEAGVITSKIDPQTGRQDPARGRANDGITDHYLLISGYRTEVQGGRWRVTRLSAVDNAAGGGAVGRLPQFEVRANGRVVKPATSATPGPAIEHEYQLTQVWVYEKDEPAVRTLDAWSP